jgi:hypothetical protein
MVLLRLFLCLACLLTASAAWSAAPQQRWQNIDRVVVFGDVHGAYQELLELLRYLEVIDEDNRWTGGTTHLVSLGDLLDRGPDSRAAMDLLMGLQQQAQASAGRVHVVLGNHEVMNLTGDLRYVSAAEYAAFAADETPTQRAEAFARMRAAGLTPTDTEFPPGYFAHRAAFAPDGRYGHWLLGLPAMIVINDNAFVHGGFPDWMNANTLEQVNAQLSQDLQQVLATGAALVASGAFPPYRDLLDSSLTPADDRSFTALQDSPFLGTNGPLWYRGTAYCHPLLEGPLVTKALAQFGVKRLVLGHSPTRTRKIQSRFDGRVLLADTGMLKSYYHGQPTAVVLQGGSTEFAYPDAGEITTTVMEPAMDRRTHLPEAAMSEFLESLDLRQKSEESLPQVTFQGMRLQPVFTPGNKRTNALRVAAFQLDQLLGLGMVPPTVATSVGGSRGTLSLLPLQTLTESQRAADDLHRPQWCAGLPDFQLMYAFDALSNNTARTPDSMLYDRVNWDLVLLPGDRAFATGAGFPGYLDRVPASMPRGLADRLQSIDLQALEQALNSTLTSRQIRAIEARRIRLLESWQVTD